MRLKYIQMECDFRQSEYTQLVELRKRERKLVDNLKSGEVVAFVSRRQNQILFVRAVKIVLGPEVVASTRWRIPAGGTWHPLMLGNYAKAAGVHLEGVKMFAQHYQEILDRVAVNLASKEV